MVATAGKLELIRESDLVLSACGRFVPPQGSVVYIPKWFLLQAVLPVAGNQTFYKEITGDTVFCWRSISVALSGSPPLVQAQVLTPDGHFLYNGRLDLTQVAGFGANRYLLSREIECAPGSKIQLNLDDNYLGAAAVQPVSFLAGGAYAYFLKDGQRSRCVEEEASNLPRIMGSPNQNLLAPCWALGQGPKIPDGVKAWAFTYGDGVSNSVVITLGHIPTAHISMPIEDTSDFHVRRFLFDIEPDAAVTGGTFLVRIRSGSGYAFTDDYLDVANYIGSSYLAKGWDVKAGDTIEFDLILVDQAGSGNISIECYADGEKRRAK